MNEQDKQELIAYILRFGTKQLPTYACQNRTNAHQLIEEINEDVRLKKAIDKMDSKQFIEATDD